MTKAQAANQPLGVYRLYWKDGGRESLATVGMLHDGTRWFAPVNWTARDVAGIASTKWRLVERMEKVF